MMLQRLLLTLYFLAAGVLFVNSQQLDIINFQQADVTITPHWHSNEVEGKVTYTFQMLKDADSVFLDAHNMTILEFKGIEQVVASEDKIWFKDSFKKNSEYSVTLSYRAKPKQTFYFMVDENDMWTQGQGKYTSHWLPSPDDTNDKMIFNISVVVPENVVAIANGKLMETGNKDGLKKWSFEMKNPMASYLAAVAVGDYKKEVLTSKSGIPLELYYKPEDEDKISFTYKYSKEIFDFLEEEIGYPYPWEVYKQVPLRDFLYAGMENTSATFFSEAFMVDEIGYTDRNYINVNAHELAHQWFGNTVTTKSDAHHWLQEGFATYYALLAEKDIFGEDYFYWQLLQSAEQLQEMSNDGNGESLLNPKASSLTFYQKGAWAIHILREKTGEIPFRTAVKNYLEKYAFQNVTTDDFLAEIKAVSDVDLAEFDRNWLQQTAFQMEEVYQSLLKSEFIKNYFEIVSLRNQSWDYKKSDLMSAILNSNEFIAQEAVYQLAFEPVSESLEFYKTALKSDNIYIRQAVAFSLERIPIELLPEYKKLLDDDSYATQEIAMSQIWNQFPEERMFVLNKMKNRVGFQNKNLRQLWLTLSYLSNPENKDKRDLLLRELTSYSSPEFSFEIREKAFQYIFDLDVWNSTSLINLIQASTHPAWRFAKSSKEILKLLFLNGNYKTELKNMEKNLDEKERKILYSIMQP